MKFEDFVSTHPTCTVVKNSSSAKSIYEDIIWNESTRIKMSELSDVGIPALVACAEQIQDYCESSPKCDLNISNDTVKQVIGRMISVAIDPLGYKPATKKRMPKEISEKTVFKNATSYSKTGVAIEKIEKHIVKVSK